MRAFRSPVTPTYSIRPPLSRAVYTYPPTDPPPCRTYVRILLLIRKVSVEDQPAVFRQVAQALVRASPGKSGDMSRWCRRMPRRPGCLVLCRSVLTPPPFRLQPRSSVVFASALRTSVGRVVLLFLTLPADMSERAQGRVRQAAGGPSRHRATRGRRRTVDTLDNTERAATLTHRVSPRCCCCSRDVWDRRADLAPGGAPSCKLPFRADHAPR